MTIIKEMISIAIEMIMMMETRMRKVPLFLILMMTIVMRKEKILV
ncbi:MAG TPA: hypothetical protein VK882_04855 [Nitrososphaeraceae archaeon]|nr:hypothetical protein [Nitrososphaeraceae archaeon]